MDEIRETFFLECEDLMEVLEDGLGAIGNGDHDPETVNTIFRAVHSIKGGAGAFGLDDLVRFAHKFETTLDKVRSGDLSPDADLIKVFLRSADMLRDLINAAQTEDTVPTDSVDELLGELESFDTASGGDAPAEEFVFEPIALDFDLGSEPAQDDTQPWKVTYKPFDTLYQRGNDCILLMRALRDLGATEFDCDDSAIPDWSEFSPEAPYLSWTVTLPADVAEDNIREVFEFVDGDCEFKLERAQAEDVPAGDGGLPPLPEIEDEPAMADATAELSDDTSRESSPVASPAGADGTARKETAKGPRQTIRVDLDRVEKLINLIGELVINQSMLAQGVIEAGISPSSSLAEGLDEFKQLTRDIQESVMAIRAQPVKPLFQRMSRIVREASSATGKQVQFVTDGENTEVDKTVIERLSDPLTHMIRNAIDHGLEKPEVREEAGKGREGTVKLSAAHKSGRVIIEIADDGAGINRNKVRQIAIDKGLISEDANLTDTEIDNLLFMPGFSTAKEVSNLSGRGVGMDVVKRSIQALGGRISIVSEEGKGSTFLISLPLTLAVLDGMIVEVCGHTKVIPLTDIVETLKPAPGDIHDVTPDSRVVFVRGEFVPLVDIGATLGYREPITEFEDHVVLLSETEEGTRSALLVDCIDDQRQVVIKGLEDNYGHVPGIAAATILGDGNIALILDVASLVSSAIRPTELNNAA